MAKAPDTTATKEPRPAGKGGGGGGRPQGRYGRRGRSGPARGTGFTGSAKGKHLVIVESPAKAKTINKYLGAEYVVLPSVGHVRDLPASDKELKEARGGETADGQAAPATPAPKGKGAKAPKKPKSPVPGVDLEHDFKPTYIVLPDKRKIISELKRAAKESRASGKEVWFATDLDREGEAIAWHLAQELEIPSKQAKRVIFPAITKGEIEKAFRSPHPIDEDRVNAQQARRILDRIVGYQVSPLLWKKVARGLSAGRVQSVAVRLVVEREREIRKFIPDEFWAIDARFALSEADARKLLPLWTAFAATKDAKGNPPTIKAQNAWLGDHKAINAELVEVGGEKFELGWSGTAANASSDTGAAIEQRVRTIAQAAGLTDIRIDTREDPSGKGPARWVRTVTGKADPATPYKIVSIETKRTSTRPGAPYITSTLQQAASSRLGFGAQRTMRAAQGLYEGVEVPGEGPVGLITYMRTDSTHLSAEAVEMARSFIRRAYGDKYLPDEPNRFASSNKAAQEAHEAIRPTSLDLPPSKVRSALNPDQLRLYQLIWDRFVACQMVPAQWDSTSVMIRGGKDTKSPLTFKASGRILAFDGFYRATGVPQAADEQTLPALKEGQGLNPFAIDPEQKFTQPPPRYTEASLIKTLESEGIGRPSTYASIISVIQDRKYVEQQERRFYSTDLGEVVTDKLIEAFPEIMDVGYTREMETQLDKVEEDHLDWVEMLRRFYGPFKKSLASAETGLTHAKAETTPAPAEYKCPDCGSPTVYRFGASGRFLSCSTYPKCKWASPVDREGKPRPAAELTNIACPKCGAAMTKRTGRFGPFLGCSRYNAKTDPCDGIVNLDRKGKAVAPSPPAYLTDLECPTCQSPLNLRNGIRGPWLGCSRFPKCRGRGKWQELPEPKRNELIKALEAHEKAHPVPILKTLEGRPLTDAKGKPLPDAPTPGATEEAEGAPETLESVAEELGV